MSIDNDQLLEICNRTTGNARDDDDSLKEMLTLYMERSDRSWKEIEDALKTMKSSEFQNNKQACCTINFLPHVHAVYCARLP